MAALTCKSCAIGIFGESLTSDDYLIIAGDFGFPWDFSAEECADIAWLESRPYTVLFVDGNHERFDHWAERPMEFVARRTDTASCRTPRPYGA